LFSLKILQAFLMPEGEENHTKNMTADALLAEAADGMFFG
jgi:hypothetical protein